MSKIIWSCWFQGIDNAPRIVKRCLASWRMNNPGWDLRVLDAATVRRYIDVEAHIDLRQQKLTATNLSDVVRLLLLHEYGGVWVDATVYCRRSLDEWLPQAMKSGFFAFANPGPDRPLASWFLAAAPGNALVTKWMAKSLGFWRGRERTDDHFWVHHVFASLLDEDAEAGRDWARVIKISANGPLSIQRAGVATPYSEAHHRIDWTAAMFKLSRRASPDILRRETLAGWLTEAADGVVPIEAPIRPEDTGAIAAMAGLGVSTGNLNHHVQLLAARELLHRFVATPMSVEIDRNGEIAPANPIRDVGGDVGILISGWFDLSSVKWPPHPRLKPLYLGFQLRNGHPPDSDAIAHFKRAGPIGCRDRRTLRLLEERGVEAYRSHCLSLTAPRRLSDPRTQVETFVVSSDERILSLLPWEIAVNASFVSHWSDLRDFGANMTRAGSFLAMYRARAKLVVTTMPCCALSAVAMGIPVVLVRPMNDGDVSDADDEEFSSIEDLVPVFRADDFRDVDWSGYAAPVGHLKLGLIDRMARHAVRWGPLRSDPVGPIEKFGAHAAP